ncbi:MAG: hypothetical protein ACRDS1_01960 [Pseudonocardiaceae bacterium]
MAMDERADSLAQRYYIKALELAGHANDHLTYCTTMRAMSVLAVDLRHTSDALRLADAASAAARKQAPGCSRSSPGNKRRQATAPKPWAKIREAEAAMDRAETRAKRSDPTTRPQ